MIQRGLDVKLNVKPIFLGLVHQYYYEGPCRFAKGEALHTEYELIMAQELKQKFFDNVYAHMPDCVNVMEPLYLQCEDDWRMPEAAFREMTKDLDQIDVFLMSGGIARSGILIELAQRTRKPIIQDPVTYADLTAVSAAVKSRGLVSYDHLTWEGVAAQMKALRTRKALQEAQILLAVRFDSNGSKSGNDTFVTLDQVTETFGTTFRFLNIHELMDYMKPIPEGGNYTTPGRLNTPNITKEEIKEAETLADELIAGADDVHIDREQLVKSCKAYVEVKKLLDYHDCCGFTAPCPDLCSTRRVNEDQFTFCLTHSLLNEQGIPSACEYDIDCVLSMLILSSISGKAPFMGNTMPLVYQNGTIRPMKRFSIEDLADVEDLTNLYHTSHSVPNRKLRGINGETAHYGIRHFAYDQGFGAVLRYNFKQDVGQEITLCRLSPDCKKLFIGKGEIVGGGDYDLDNCNGYVVYRVADQEKYFKAQCQVGNHLPLIYGDYARELELLGESLGLELLKV
ncbi:MAG: fucose isomerase [Oscillospiraceae bacterium]|nr:fucose isomerase [Oscillospiraceae bacterium]